jgi:outer membrane receptor protein involved in Fe transport
MILGADDLFKLYLEEKEGPEGQFFGTLATLFDFHMGLVRWEWEPERDKRVRVTGRIGYNGFDVGLGDVFNLDVDSYAGDLRTEFIWDARDDLVLLSDIETNFQPYTFTGKVPPTPPKEGEQGTPPDLDDFITFTETGDRIIVAPYVDLAWQVTETLTLNPGLRFESYQNSSGFSFLGLEPRFATRWDVSETTTLKGQIGHHRQPPFEEQQSVSVGNPDLEVQKSWQYALGFEQKIGDSVLADIQGFYKDMWGLVVSPDPLEDTEDVSVSEGVGRVFGLEAIIRHDPTEMFFGWVSYTLMRAERRDRPGESWRPFDFDQTHILTAVGVFQLGSGWEAGFRFRHTTGNPYDPITAGIYNVDSDFYIPVYGGPNSGRLPDFQQLDLRVDKKWIYDDWMLNLYLEVQNVYLHENVEGSAYSYDFAERIPVTGIPIVPNFGLRADF